MMKQNKTPKLQGAQGFDAYYTEIFSQRWPSLKESLLKETVHAELRAGGVESYFLDPGSVCAALTLPVEGGEKLLDLCAAPGGKTLVIASNMDEEARLYSNERSPERKVRLAKVISTCLPESISQRITASCSDGATWCRRETESFDRILLDVPCSSERHVLQDPKYLKEWTPSRIKTLSMEQWALLSSAWRLLKKDGYLIYSTCALSPEENDKVVQKLSKKFPDAIHCTRQEMTETFLKNLQSLGEKLLLPEGLDIRQVYDGAEQTEFGFHVLPDTDYGTGPLYFTLLKKAGM